MSFWNLFAKAPVEKLDAKESEKIYDVGSDYLNGRNFPQNYAKAREFFTKVAYQGCGVGSIRGFYGLGLLALSEESNRVKAYANLTVAAAKAWDTELWEPCSKFRDRLEREMAPSDVRAAQKLAEKIWKRLKN
jgi:TPR repeat protein